LIVKTDAYLRFECPAGEATFSVEHVDVVPRDEKVTIYFETGDLDDECTRLQNAAIEVDHMPADMPGYGARRDYVIPTGTTYACSTPALTVGTPHGGLTPGNWTNFWCVPDRTAAGAWRLVPSN